MKNVFDLKTTISAVVGLVIGVAGMGATVVANPEYIIGWAASRYCKQDTDARLTYRERLYEVTKPHRLTMECNTGEIK